MPEICINYPILHIHADGDDDDDVTQSDYKMADKWTERRAAHTHTQRDTDTERQLARSRRLVAAVWFSLSLSLSSCCCCHLRHNYATFVCSTERGRGEGSVGSWGRSQHCHCCGLNVLRILNAICICHFVFNINIAHSLSHTLTLTVSLSLPHSGRCIQETQTGTQQRPVNGFRRHHIARKWTFLAESARRPHPNHSILPNASQTKTSNHIHTGQYTPPPPLQPLLRHLFKHSSLLSLSLWLSACRT